MGDSTPSETSVTMSRRSRRFGWLGRSASAAAISAGGVLPRTASLRAATTPSTSLARAAVIANQDPDARTLAAVAPGAPLPPLGVVRETAVAEAEQRYLRELLRRAANVRAAVALSGLSRSRLYALLKKHDLPTTFRAD